MGLKGNILSDSDLALLTADLPVAELDFLLRLAALDTSTLNKEGVTFAQNLVSERLERMGFKEKRLRGDERFADLIVAERPGRQNSFITLITHTDTVLPNERELTLDLPSGRAFVSGAIDNKGGVVTGLSGLERFLTHFPKTEYGLRWICSPNEEMGSIGFTEIFRSFADDTVAALGLEPALDDGSIIHQRRGNRWYNIEIVGREAHAGRSRSEHANAAHDMAMKITELARLNHRKKEISVNIGHVEGGKDKHNVICGRVSAKLDVRFPNHESRDLVHKRVHKILMSSSDKGVCGDIPTETRYEVVDDCPPFSLNRRSARMAKAYSAFVSQLEGRRVVSAPSGGAGDVNYLSGPDTLVLDGLGPVGGGMHTTGEFVEIASLKTRSQALSGFLHYLQKVKLERP